VEASFAAAPPQTQVNNSDSIIGSAAALQDSIDPAKEHLVHTELTLNKFASEEGTKTMTQGDDVDV